MLPIPSSKTQILFVKPFDEKLKDLIIKKVLETSDINGIRSDFSSEGGINLPLGSEWVSPCLELKNKKYLDYHDSRQLRFINCHLEHSVSDNNKIIGMRCKDGINYFTDEELTKIKECIDDVIILM